MVLGATIYKETSGQTIYVSFFFFYFDNVGVCLSPRIEILSKINGPTYPPNGIASWST